MEAMLKHPEITLAEIVQQISNVFGNTYGISTSQYFIRNFGPFLSSYLSKVFVLLFQDL